MKLSSIKVAYKVTGTCGYTIIKPIPPYHQNPLFIVAIIIYIQLKKIRTFNNSNILFYKRRSILPVF